MCLLLEDALCYLYDLLVIAYVRSVMYIDYTFHEDCAHTRACYIASWLAIMNAVKHIYDINT